MTNASNITTTEIENTFTFVIAVETVFANKLSELQYGKINMGKKTTEICRKNRNKL